MSFREFCQEHREVIKRMIEARRFSSAKLEILEAFGFDIPEGFRGGGE